ncbi:MAG: hypothetical protein NXI04_15110 [Planctomycetaceae bacterium]|nr:hypothetical protein [Planctomycetaceae bacterium]
MTHSRIVHPLIALLFLPVAQTGCRRHSTAEHVAASPGPDAAVDRTRNPSELAGIWQWQWTDGIIQHVVLSEDGSVRRFHGTDLVADNGRWQVDGYNLLQITFADEVPPQTFRIDSLFRMTDLQTLPTDRDFPWCRVHRLTTKLSRENIIRPPDGA